MIADSSSRLCDLAMFSDLSPEDFTVAIKDLLKAYSQHVPMSLKDTYILLAGVVVGVERFCSDYKIDLVPKALTQRIETRLQRQQPPKRIKTPAPLKPKPVPQRSPIEIAINKLKAVMADPPFVVSRAYMIALEAMVEDQMLDDCILFRRKGATDAYAQAHGCGKLYVRTSRKVSVNKADSDVFGLTISRKKDVIFASAEGEKVQEFLPDWLRNFKGIRALYALPIEIAGECEAMILGVSWTGLFTDLDGERLATLRRLRDTLAEVMEASRICGADGDF